MLVIMIAGCSGSGKTTIAARLCKQLSNKTNKHCTILTLDNYQHDFSHLSFEERSKLNFDLPNITNWKLLRNDLEMLKSGETIEIRPYNFELHKPGDATLSLEPPDILIIEGIHAHHPEITDIADCRLFVKASRDSCYQRRLQRDTKPASEGGRGRTENSVKQQFDNQVWPAYLQHIKPKKAAATFVIHNDGQLNKLDTSAACSHIMALLPAEHKGKLTDFSLMKVNHEKTNPNTSRTTYTMY